MLVFTPGGSVRAAIDGVLERKLYLPGFTPASPEATQARGIALLACHFVLGAACAMAGAAA
jgi:hypothetical protein